MNHLKARAIKVVKFGAKVVLAPKDAKRELKNFYENRKNNRLRAVSYKIWFQNHYPSDNELAVQRAESKKLSSQPLISIILPIYNTNKKHLKLCIESVIAQSYPHWELCVADDASITNVLDVVKEYAKKHKNIKWTRLEKNLHIAGSSNAALKLAEGEFIALLDHDDLLMPNALYEAVKVLNSNPALDLIYSDEDKVDDRNHRSDPFLKPDWSPEFLKSCNYITHFAVLRHSIVNKIGGFRIGTEGAQDWDLFLRFTQRTQAIHHVPKILYAWRKSGTSTAKSADTKPYAYINQLRVLRDAVKAEAKEAAVLGTQYMGFWNVKYHPQDTPLVSIVIPTKDNYKLIKGCLESIIEKTSYPYFEIILVDTGSTEKQVRELYQSKLVTANPVKIVKWNKPFNFSRACNLGVKHAQGTYLLFLNNDTEVVTPEWIENMLGFAQMSGVGMVGCKLIFPNRHIQHAGVVLSQRDVAFHPFYGQNQGTDIFTNIYISNIRNCAAVTAACSMVAKDKFNKVGGFDEKLRVTYNDVDLCLRLLSAGYRNVYTPYTELLHYESKSIGSINTRSRDGREVMAARDLMLKRWGKLLQDDPYYNRNYIQSSPGYKLRR